MKARPLPSGSEWTPRGCARLRLTVAGFLTILGSVAVTVSAWEGHDWDQWRQVTTWRKPELSTEQAGRSNLVALLGEGDGRLETRAAWEQRRAQIADTIQQVLGAPASLERLPVQVEELGSEERDGYTRRHIRIRSEPDDWIPAYLLVPAGAAAAPGPAMICLHQTVAQGKEEPCGIRGDPELALAVELVKRGYTCLAPDMIGFGERIAPGKQPYDASLGFYRRHPGWSFFGKMIWDIGDPKLFTRWGAEPTGSARRPDGE